MAGEKNLELWEQVKYVREGGDVKRLHTIPIIKSYSVGQHCFNMLGMLRVLRPEAPAELIWAILEHDLPERMIGDMPSPAKWFGLLDTAAVDAVEEELNGRYLPQYNATPLDEYEKSWLDALDMIELYCFCLDEVMLGNKNVSTIISNIHHIFEELLKSYPAECVMLFKSIQGSTWEILPDIGLEHLR